MSILKKAFRSFFTHLAKVVFTFSFWGKVVLYQLSYFRNMFPKEATFANCCCSESGSLAGVTGSILFEFAGTKIMHSLMIAKKSD
ncbi:hypothetical protein JS578_12000 [Dysgonomonadaceae bacterium zrk40]|nr:hypothetical protein JS578_12000 [Dysgonomonadaceae bacterium zrk40]